MISWEDPSLPCTRLPLDAHPHRRYMADMSTFTPQLTRARVFHMAWPMIFANAAVPLAGVADTAVIGMVGDKSDLGGVALGVVVFNVFYWSFYFLRMSSTGLTAQAMGAGDRASAQRVLLRALMIAAGLGFVLLTLRTPVAALGFHILQGDEAVEATGSTYFLIRSWGAPGAYALFALTGWLIGLGRMRAVLIISIAMSAINIGLDVWFVLDLNMGVGGVAAATAISELSAAVLAAVLVWREVRKGGGWAPGALDWARLSDPVAVRRLFAVNFDLMLRTWGFVFGFSWFANSGAQHGAAVLAGNHVLLQIITVTAFVLDAFAFVAEREVGHAVGSKSLSDLRRAIRLTAEFTVVSGFLFMVAMLAFGPALLNVWIADPEVRASALRFLPYCALTPFLGAAAWQLDGVFIGATRSTSMRNASLVAVVIYVALDVTLSSRWGPDGMWLAFLGYYIARAATLAVAYPGLERAAMASAEPTAS